MEVSLRMISPKEQCLLIWDHIMRFIEEDEHLALCEFESKHSSNIENLLFKHFT